MQKTDFWKTKKVLLTGGSGFLGSYLIEKLNECGCKEIIVPRSAQCNLVNEENVERLYGDTRPHIVIHGAATVGGIGANSKEPGRFFYENAIMGIHMIEHARRAKVEKFLCIGSICAYPKFAKVPFAEDHIWDGYPEETNAPYGIAKKSLMVMLDAYYRQYGLCGLNLMPVNLYGPRDNFDPSKSHVIPALIRRAVIAKQKGLPELIVWGSGRATREFLYATDAAEGILMAAEEHTTPEPINLGAGFEISIRELVELIVEVVGFEGDVIWDATKPDGQPRRMVDSSRAQNAFGFKAKTSFRVGLEHTVNWYLKHQEELELSYANSGVEI